MGSRAKHFFGLVNEGMLKWVNEGNLFRRHIYIYIYIYISIYYLFILIYYHVYLYDIVICRKNPNGLSYNSLLYLLYIECNIFNN